MRRKAPDQRPRTATSSKVRKPGAKPARREVLTLGAAATIGLAAPAIGQESSAPVIWNMATPWPRKSPGYFSAADRLAASITTMSGGRLRVTAHGAGEKVAPEKLFAAVSQGTVALGHSSPHLWAEINPAFQFFTGIPFGLTAPEHAGWIDHGGGQSLWDKAYEPHGIKPFLAGNTGAQAGGWFRREIRNPEDFNGLKFRISGIGAAIVRLLGAVPVDLPPSEIFPAMQAEKVDGVKWAGPWNDLTFGLQKLARYYYLPGVDDVSYAFELMINIEAWEALPADLQAIVREAVKSASAQTSAEFTYYNIQALDLLETKTSTIVNPFPDNVVRAMGEASAEVIDNIAATSRFARAIQSSYFGYLSKAVDYTRASEFILIQQRQAVQK